ncbi:MAG: hypothetical protein RJA67_251 [Bacteroidota bacterium]
MPIEFSPIYMKYKITLLFLLALLTAKAQTTDSTYHVSGGASATNNGISLLPMFTLGKPALIFDLSVGNSRLAFEPQFRFSMEGKPWSFIFWFRYKAINTKKFRFNVGAHPSVAFRTSNLFDAQGNPKSILGHQQYIATEWIPTYQVSKNVSVGIYYLVSRGISDGATDWTNFLTLNTTISNIPITKDVALRLYPQIYVLNMDGKQGYYITDTATLSHKNWPFTISSTLNKRFSSDIPGDDFVWNIALNYAFNKRFKRL